jgi:hypothetical protein
MEPIYKSPVISFINTSSGTSIEHASGDYSALNIKLKRLEKIILEHQPEQPLVFSYTPPKKVDSLDKPENKHLLVGKDKVMAGIFTIRETVPSHTFVVPPIGSQPSIASFVKLDNFDDYHNQVSMLTDLVDRATSSFENEYDEHPLLHNHHVAFRRAKYIDNRQAFSFWNADKPTGDYPLSKPFFDNIIEQLDQIGQPYQIYVDFVSDWKEQYSSFNGPPKKYGIEVNVIVDGEAFPVIKAESTEKELRAFAHDHDLLDNWLKPMFATLNAQIPSFYAFIAQHKEQDNNGENKNHNKAKLH